jgi:hypothetical protein
MPASVRRASLVVLAATLAVFASACGSKQSPAGPTPGPEVVPIMGPSRLTAGQLVAWFNGRQPRPSGAYGATVPVETLAPYYIEEGAAEGVAGDVAFVQSVLETGWFRFSPTVPGWMNNFAGIGATDTNPAPAVFPDARTGVRAQIQHLRAHADPAAYACSVPPLANPCVDPRFALVVPKGKAPTWNQMGNGNWATDPAYASKILTLYAEAKAFNGVR